MRLQKYLQSAFNLDEAMFKSYQRLCLHMIKNKVLAASLDDLKFGFLELAVADTVDVSAVELRQIVKKYVNNSAESFEDRFTEVFCGEEGTNRVSFDQL